MSNVLRTGPGTKIPQYTVVIITSIIKAEHIIEKPWEDFFNINVHVEIKGS